MRNAVALRVVLLVLTLALALRFDGAAAEPPEATNRMAVLQQRVQDLVDYREWSDTQIAAMKVTIADLQRRLAACNVSPKETPR